MKNGRDKYLDYDGLFDKGDIVRVWYVASFNDVRIELGASDKEIKSMIGRTGPTFHRPKQQHFARKGFDRGGERATNSPTRKNAASCATPNFNRESNARRI